MDLIFYFFDFANLFLFFKNYPYPWNMYFTKSFKNEFQVKSQSLAQSKTLKMKMMPKIKLSLWYHKRYYEAFTWSHCLWSVFHFSYDAREVFIALDQVFKTLPSLLKLTEYLAFKINCLFESRTFYDFYWLKYIHWNGACNKFQFI